MSKYKEAADSWLPKDLTGDLYSSEVETSFSGTINGKPMTDSQLGQYKDMANNIVNETMKFVGNFGIAGLKSNQDKESKRSYSDVFFNGKKLSEDDELPTTPGKAYGTHLFKYNNGAARLKEEKIKSMGNGANIFTENMEALKVALSSMGIASDRNPGGMPIDIRDAKKIWFGDKEDIDPIEESSWSTSVQLGDTKLDPKRVRKFVNEDGSLTWEVLNDDKTVMSRFTMGDYAGTKIFSQGGHSVFAKMLKKAQEKLGPDTGGQFDAIRSMFGG